MKLGILGGGQLSWMLAQAAEPLGVPVRALAQTPEDPVTGLEGVEVLQAPIMRPLEAPTFFEGLTHLTVESEFVPVLELEKVGRLFPELPLFPSTHVLKTLQDKLEQKKLLATLGIQHAAYDVFEPTTDEATPWLARLNERFPMGSVLKWARWGYDGKGNFMWGKGRDAAAALEFCKQGLAKGARVFAEEKVVFDRELAIVSVRSSARGEFAAYPLVESVQKDGVCLEVRGPATQFGVPLEIAKHANQIAFQLAKYLDITGCFAIEFFWVPETGLIVNELAPRVHNSGHYSQLFPGSQFENHVRAVCGLDLRPVYTEDAFLMRNLLGPTGASRDLRGWQTPRAPEGLELWWYGKSQLQPGRKMGHINARATTTDEFRHRVQQARDFEEQIWRSLA